MRMPGRVHITWQDDKTLKIETDAGTQTRLFHFDAPPTPTEDARVAGLLRRELGTAAAGVGLPEVFRGLCHADRHTRPLARGDDDESARRATDRKNGLPYSADAKVEEYFDYHKEPNGDEWFTVTTVVVRTRST